MIYIPPNKILSRRRYIIFTIVVLLYIFGVISIGLHTGISDIHIGIAMMLLQYHLYLESKSIAVTINTKFVYSPWGYIFLVLLSKSVYVTAIFLSMPIIGIVLMEENGMNTIPWFLYRRTDLRIDDKSLDKEFDKSFNFDDIYQEVLKETNQEDQENS